MGKKFLIRKEYLASARGRTRWWGYKSRSLAGLGSGEGDMFPLPPAHLLLHQPSLKAEIAGWYS